jgi:uncharacterized damage-inducible protein DinB
MTTAWTAPEIHRREPPATADERSALEAWLDYHRDTLLWKCTGLTAEQLATRSTPPSSLSLLGLVRHMTEVERGWFRIHAARQDVPDVYCTDEDPDADFNAADAADAPADLERFTREIETCRTAVTALGLDALCPHPQGGREPHDLRWIYLHMIEEYARHNGHADLLRERIDGVTGD